MLEFVAMKILHELDEWKLYTLIKKNLMEDLGTNLEADEIERPVRLSTDSYADKQDWKWW